MFELDDEFAESDVPTTLIRSKADCPTMEVSSPSSLPPCNVASSHAPFVHLSLCLYVCLCVYLPVCLLSACYFLSAVCLSLSLCLSVSLACTPPYLYDVLSLPVHLSQVTTLTTNDIVINKLTQILSYLRQGARVGKKARKRDRGKA